MDVNLVSKTWPKEETFSLISQSRRSALSIPSNIAEGFARFSRKEFMRFLTITLGSCAELQTQLEIAFRLNYLDEASFKQLDRKLDQERKMIKKLMNK